MSYAVRVASITARHLSRRLPESVAAACVEVMYEGSVPWRARPSVLIWSGKKDRFSVNR